MRELLLRPDPGQSGAMAAQSLLLAQGEKVALAAAERRESEAEGGAEAERAGEPCARPHGGGSGWERGKLNSLV